jgi:hypothetical protein
MPTPSEIATELRAIARRIRTQGIPLADLIPALQRMADALDDMETHDEWEAYDAAAKNDV